MLSHVLPTARRPVLASSRKSKDPVSYEVLHRASSTSATARPRLRANLRKGPALDEFVHKATSLARKRDEGRLHVRASIPVLRHACARNQLGLNS